MDILFLFLVCETRAQSFPARFSYTLYFIRIDGDGEKKLEVRPVTHTLK
jgi:hypothetical protein